MITQRDQIENILKTLDTGTLLKLLSVAGINPGQPAMDPMGSIIDELALSPGEMEKLPSWNEYKAPVSDDGRPPIINKGNIIEEMMAEEPFLMPEGSPLDYEDEEYEY